MVRRSIAAGAGLLVLILLVVGLRACLNSRNERAIKDYVRDVNALVGESNQQSKLLFDLLGSSGSTGDVSIENKLNELRVTSDQFVDRAHNISTPGDMDGSRAFVLQTMEFRRDGVNKIADDLPAAIAQKNSAKQGTNRIAADMQDFLASDVIYLQRAVPAMTSTLKEKGLGETITASQFLPNVDWLQPTTVSDRISKLGGSGGGGAASPGLHGDGLGSVTLGGTALTPGESASVTLASDLAFSVEVLNQGENTETNVKVTVTVGQGADATKLTKTLDTIAAGETKAVDLPLTAKPPTGQNVPVTVEVGAVPGETKTDNNKGDFSVIFTS
jgi:hypothetical protein